MPRQLTAKDIQWIQNAIQMAAHGKVTLVTQNSKIMKIVAESYEVTTVSIPTPKAGGLDNIVNIEDILQAKQR